MDIKYNYMKYILALLLFGSNGIVASRIRLSSYEIVCLRTLVGSLLLIALFFLLKNKFTFYKHRKSALFLTISGIAMGISWMFLYEAYQQVGVSIASLCYYCGPVIVMAISPILFQEKLTGKKLIGFAVVLIGICLINNQALLENGNLFGIFCGLMSAIMYSLMVICNKKATPITGMENATLQLTISCITATLFVLFKQGLAIQIAPTNIPWIMILGLLNTGIGCFLYFSSIGNLSVQSVAITGYLEPLSSVSFAVFLLHESMSSIQVLGAVCIIGGAVWSERIT